MTCFTFPTKTIQEAGYIYVWLSYDDDSNNWVYFDDFKVTHTPSAVIQSNEYYPFGLQTSNSWTRENTTGNNFLYNEGSELNANTGWYDTPYRGYDATLGRFMQVDPLASSQVMFNAYHYAYNNPVGFNDPMGLDPRNKPLPTEYESNSGSGSGGGGWASLPFGKGKGSWADGIRYSDWSSQGGSATYQAGVAMGLTDIGGILYQINPNGTRSEFTLNQGEIGFLVPYNYVQPLSAEERAMGVSTDGTVVVSYKFEEAQTQGGQESPDEIRRRFGDSFFRNYFMPLISIVPHHDLDDKTVIRNIRTATEAHSNRILKDADGRYNMRAIYYEIQKGDQSGWIDKSQTFIQNIIDPSLWTMDPIWGNPGSLRSDGSIGAFQYNTDSGSRFYLIVHFQRIPENM